MTKIIATSKQRLLQYLDYKGVTITDFYKNTGIKRGFLDSNKLTSTISDVFLAKIIAFYSDLNLVWLITGIGEFETKMEGNKVAEDTAAYKKLEIINKVFGETTDVEGKLDTLIEMVGDKFSVLEDKFDKIALIYKIDQEIENTENGS